MRNRLAVRDQEAVVGPVQRRPAAHAGRDARLRQIDRRAAAEIVAACRRAGNCARAMPQPSSAGCEPSETKPSTDQVLTNSLGSFGMVETCVSRSAMWMTLTPSRCASSAHSPRLAGHRRLQAGVCGDVEQRLLHQVRHQPRIGAVRQHRGRRARIAGAQPQRFLAHRVVGALGGRDGRVGVAAGPGLDAGIEVHRALFPAVADQGDARDVDRDIQQEVAAPEQRIEHAAEILARQRLLDELDAVARRLFAPDVVGA